MGSIDSSDNDKELTSAKGKGFKSPGKLFVKRSTGDDTVETAGS